MKRLTALDALRGFDMFRIMGGEGLACAVTAILGIDVKTAGWLAAVATAAQAERRSARPSS